MPTIYLSETEIEAVGEALDVWRTTLEGATEVYLNTVETPYYTLHTAYKKMLKSRITSHNRKLVKDVLKEARARFS